MNLDQLEKRLQTLIEVDLLRYLPIKTTEGNLAHELAKALYTNIIKENGEKVGPNTYTLKAHPITIQEWQDDAVLVHSLHDVINAIVVEADLVVHEPLSFSLAPDPDLNPDEVQILASHRIETISETQGMETKKDDSKTSDEKIPQNAFLIVHGTKVFPLAKTVVNIGRRMENELTIDDPRVSRNHAQLRVVNGRYVIFDLNSTGGTSVNSQRSHQSVLYPGDVISLAGVPLIFGQDNPPRRNDLRETAPFQGNSSASERPTTILHTPPGFDEKEE